MGGLPGAEVDCGPLLTVPSESRCENPGLRSELREASAACPWGPSHQRLQGVGSQVQSGMTRPVVSWSWDLPGLRPEPLPLTHTGDLTVNKGNLTSGAAVSLLTNWTEHSSSLRISVGDGTVCKAISTVLRADFSGFFYKLILWGGNGFTWCRISKMPELCRARPALPAPPHPGGFLFPPPRGPFQRGLCLSLWFSSSLSSPSSAL